MLWLTSGPKQGAGWLQNHRECAKTNPWGHRLLFPQMFLRQGKKNWLMWWLICLIPNFCTCAVCQLVVHVSHSLTPSSKSTLLQGEKLSSSFLSFWMLDVVNWNETTLKKARSSQTSEAWFVWHKINICWWFMHLCIYLLVCLLCVCACTLTMGCMWRSGNNLQELALSFNYRSQGSNLGCQPSQ